MQSFLRGCCRCQDASIYSHLFLLMHSLTTGRSECKSTQPVHASGAPPDLHQRAEPAQQLVLQRSTQPSNIRAAHGRDGFAAPLLSLSRYILREMQPETFSYAYM